MPTSTAEWIPYATPNAPLNWPDLPEWDSVLILGQPLPIEGIPRYTKHLERQNKRGPGQDNQKTTSKGVKPSPISITLKLWVDVSLRARTNSASTAGNLSNFETGVNWLDRFRVLLPKILAPRFDKRFAVPVYHPVLEAYGVTSVLFFDVPTPQHVGNRVFHVELQGDNAADLKDGTATKVIKKPDTNSLGATSARGGKFGLAVQTIPRVDGTSYTQAWQGRINTPSSRSGLPDGAP